jgi:phage tail tube protein FII
MHEGREEAVMRRRKIKSLMETTEENEEDEENHDMVDIVTEIDLGGFKAAENREKVKKTCWSMPKTKNKKKCKKKKG